MSTSSFEIASKAWPPLSQSVRVPHSDAEYQELVDFLDYLTNEVGENEEHPLASLMDVIGVLIEKHEDGHAPELRS